MPNPKWADVDAKWQAVRKRIDEITRRVGADTTLEALRGERGNALALLDKATRKDLADALKQAFKL